MPFAGVWLITGATSPELRGFAVTMKIRVGYEVAYQSPQQTAMVLTLRVHPSRAADLVTPDPIVATPPIAIGEYHDSFGNICSRIVAPAGRLTLSTEAIVRDNGETDVVASSAGECAIADLPPETLLFLLGSRYCETDLLSETAWSLFGNTPRGWGRVQAICDFVHGHVGFGYEHANATKTALNVLAERKGVCRDFAHLAITLCRCMSIPARYCTGYLGEIGVPPDPAPMDFSAWFEAYLGRSWYTFDARHNAPRIGRILIGRGRDAADVALSTSYGPTTLVGFKVVTDEIVA
jgi:transglutaminase-like putative cysteine protease